MMETSQPLHDRCCRVSVIVVSYNARQDLQRCFDSMLPGLGPDTEVILVDNASHDGSADMVMQSFPIVTVIRNLENVGFGAANNLGVRAATGDYMVFLNPDTIVAPGWLDALIEPLREDNQIGMTTAKILLLEDDNHVNACGNDVHFTGLTLCRGIGKSGEQFGKPMDVGAVSGAAFAMCKTVFEQVGGFDAQFFLYMEDTDLSLRVRLMDYRVIYVPTSVIYHDYALTFNARKTFYQELNRYMMLLKTLRWRTLVLLSPGFFLAELVTWGFVLARDRGNLANKLRAYAAIIQNWECVMRSRKTAQGQRLISDRDLLQSTTYRLEFEQTGDDLTTQLAHTLFDPLFFVVFRFAMLTVRW